MGKATVLLQGAKTVRNEKKNCQQLRHLDRLYLHLSFISWMTSKVHFKKADVNSGQS